VRRAIRFDIGRNLGYPAEGMRTLSLVLLFFSAAVGVPAQQAPPSNVTPLLLPGLGRPDHPIATKNAEAQKYFDQGLQLVFGFNRAEAVRSFRRASQLDPHAAMPYWGMALAYGRHMNMDQDMDVSASEAYKAIQQALKLSSTAVPNEREYIQALAERCAHGENTTWQQSDEAYAAAMQHLAAHYPDDLDAAALSLEARMVLHRYEWFQGTTPEHSTPAIMNDIESLLRRAPDHPLANHLYIHILDTGHPEIALGVAYRIGSIAPGLGHLVHMPSHIFFNLGDYEMAARVNEQASVAEERYMQLANPGDTAYTLFYYMHDLHFVARSRAEQGLCGPAIAYANKTAERIASAQDQWPMFSDYYLPVPLLTLLRCLQWEEVLRLTEPWPNRPMDTALWHFGRAMALAAKADLESARAEQRLFEQLRSRLPKDTMWMFNPGDKLLAVASPVLAGRLAPDPEQAIPIWRKAVKAQDELGYDEPPAFYYPVRESLGGALLRAGKPAEAESVFRECLQQNPRDPHALFGLSEALKAQGKSDAADSVRRLFSESWKTPDVGLRVQDL
jgi:tetratricopeptide (TPR) repeat protein